jgi:DNA-binding transcriptional LysR family regulator
MRQFVAVAEELHFGRAARRLNMAQPPLSQSIRRLEADLGVELFDRSGRGVELTRAGAAFLEQARRTLVQADLARKVARREAERAPEVRVSFIGPALYRILPALLVSHRSAVPGVHLRLFEHSSPEQVAALAAGEFDIGFVTATHARETDGELLLVERTRFLAAVPADWEIGARGAVTLAQLAEQPFILPPQRYAAQSSEIMAAFKRIGSMPRVAQEATQTNTTVRLIGAGLGCSIVVATAAMIPAPNVRFLPIDDEVQLPLWEMFMVWHPGQIGEVAGAFVEFVREFMAAHPRLTDASTPVSLRAAVS